VFDELTTKLAGVFRKLTGRGKLSEQEVRDGIREIRRVLLEADVNLAVARDLCKRVEERAIGTELLQSVAPGQQVVKIVFDELVKVLGGGTPGGMQFPSNRSATVLMAGLQGSGKTTSAAKLARFWKERG